MSASEKLRAMEERLAALSITPQTFGEELDAHMAAQDAEAAYLAILPQIRALVEAAEEHSEIAHGVPVDCVIPLHAKLARALADLEEMLP